MGSYRKILKEYKDRGSFNEDKMWLSVDALDKDILDKLEEEDAELYWDFMRDQHEIFCGKHFDERFGKWEVENMYHIDSRGNKISGAHWGIHEVKQVYESMSIPKDVTLWDFAVALNANWHDKVELFKEWFPDDYEDKIIRDAVVFYFKDSDAPEGKIWTYMRYL